MKNCLIFYARLPTSDMMGKTRIGKQLQNQNFANQLARALIIDTFNEYYNYSKNNYDFIWYYKGNLEKFNIHNVQTQFIASQKKDNKEYPNIQFIPQISGELSLHHIHKKASEKYKNTIIIGSDIPCISGKNIQEAFHILENSSNKQCVIKPVEDGGYGLIGMNGFYDLYSDIKNWNSGTHGYELFEETKKIAKKIDVNIHAMEKTFDIDYVEDLKKLSEIIDKYEYLIETKKVIQNLKF